MSHSGDGLRRGLGVLTLAATIFIFISSGPFGLEAMVREAGPGAAPLMLVLTLLFWGLSHALVASELSSAMPEEGGFFRWIGAALGDFWGFQAAWWYWVKMLADTSIYPILFGEYLKYWFPDLTTLEERGVRIALVWLFVGINLRGIRTGGRLAVAFTLFILLPFAIFVARGGAALADLSLRPFVAEGKSLRDGLGLALLMGMWCWNTLDSVSVVAGEVHEPRRTFARAYALAIPTALGVYLLPILVGLAVDPDYAGWEDHHFSTLGRRIGGEWLGAWIALAALASNVSLFHGALMVNTRVPMVLAEQRRFPSAFASIGRRSGSPWVSLLFDGGVYTLIALLVERFVDIIVFNQCFNAAIYTLLYLSFLVLRRSRPDLERRFRVPGGWPGALAVCAGPFFVCWIGVPRAVLDYGWLWLAGVAGLATGPLAFWTLGRWVRPRGRGCVRAADAAAPRPPGPLPPAGSPPPA
jgi:amino acid transporter